MTLSRLFVRPLAMAGLILLAPACGVMTGGFPSAVSRPARDAPERFVRDDRSAITGTPGAAPCTSPILDPRTGARLTLERSSGGRGDYAVPAGRYGIGAGELLRVDCATGLAVGVVRG